MLSVGSGTHAPNMRITSFADDATEMKNTEVGSASDTNIHPNSIASPILKAECKYVLKKGLIDTVRIDTIEILEFLKLINV